MQNKRTLYLDICNYKKQVLCSLYDNSSQISGQAVDVFVTTERNGWKELSFTLPSTCIIDGKKERNYRLDYLKADYMVRLIDEEETEWFIISEPRVSHNGFSQNVNVVAGHVSQLLKFKNLGLEFSDDEGNNTGTAQQLAETILSGTGWSVGEVYPFAEKDGSAKYRSLKASAKTGAFKLMASMCELFDAKPIYHGDTRTVDILPINPFSDDYIEGVPDLSLVSEVVELHYGTNVSNVTRTLNTENLVTKLYAYGSYGDNTSGYCGIDECMHTEHTYTLNNACRQNNTYYFSFTDDAGVNLTYHFVPHNNLNSGNKLIYSLLDQASMMYIWDETNRCAYPVTKGTKGTLLPASSSTNIEVQNWFQFLMNYNYYRESGLFTDDMVQMIARYQRDAPAKYQAVSDASVNMSESRTTLSETIGNIDFCRLAISSKNTSFDDGYIALELDKRTYADGVIYRTDYDKNADYYFKWRTTESLNADGDPINTAASILYIIHNTTPLTWDKAYLKTLDDEDDPSIISLWAATGSIAINPSTDRFYLFSYNGINGLVGALEANDEAAVMSLEDTLQIATVKHPVIFTTDDPALMSVGTLNGYGWAWRYYNNKALSDMYFCYQDKGDTKWNKVYFQATSPGGGAEKSYWFNWKTSVLYQMIESQWTELDNEEEQKVAKLFTSVYALCKSRDRYYQGLSEEYTYQVPAGPSLPAGNYYFKNKYDSYWAFTTEDELPAGSTLTYKYKQSRMVQVVDNVETVLKQKGYRFDNVRYHTDNILSGIGIENGNIGSNGSLVESTQYSRIKTYASVIPNTSYDITGSSVTFNIHFYNSKKAWLSSVSSKTSFTTPANCCYVLLSAPVAAASFTGYSQIVISAHDADNKIIIEDLNYTKLVPTASESTIGLWSCMHNFVVYSDDTYIARYNALTEAQNDLSVLENEVMESVGDLYREGWWQDESYVDEDEDKLYNDAADNLREISKPEATYSVTYLDLHDANTNMADYSVSSETEHVSWPKLKITDAIHLVDPEIGVNCWAYFDKIKQCYDKEWQTKITINTQLSTISQHSFTDVMTNIANVANDIKGKVAYYNKTAANSVSPGDINEIKAGLSYNDREFSSVFRRVDTINDAVVTQSTRITQTADSILSEVSNKYATQAALNEQKSSITQTQNAITSIVSLSTTNAAGEVTSYSGSKLEQTLNGFSQEITGKDANNNPVSSSLRQTVNGLSAEVTGYDENGNEVQSSLRQTVNGLSAEVTGVDENGNEVQSSLRQRVDGILMSVQEQNANSESGNEFKTSSVSITAEGVAIATGGKFTVESENFSVNAEGRVSASNALLSGSVYSNGYPVLTTNDIIVSTTEPTGRAGMLWIKPGVANNSSGSGGSSGGTITEPTSVSANYEYSINYDTRKYVGSSASESNYSGTLSGSGTSATVTSCTYEARVPIYLQTTSTGKTGCILCLKISNADGATITLKGNVDQGNGAYQIAVLTCNSPTWIGNSDTLEFRVYAETRTGYSRGNVLNSRDNSLKLTLRCYGSK